MLLSVMDHSIQLSIMKVPYLANELDIGRPIM